MSSDPDVMQSVLETNAKLRIVGLKVNRKDSARPGRVRAVLKKILTRAKTGSVGEAVERPCIQRKTIISKLHKQVTMG